MNININQKQNNIIQQDRSQRDYISHQPLGPQQYSPSLPSSSNFPQPIRGNQQNHLNLMIGQGQQPN
jgi:hypothetical protein